MINIYKHLMKHSAMQRDWTIPAIYSSIQKFVNFSQDSHAYETKHYDNKHAVMQHSPNSNNVISSKKYVKFESNNSKIVQVIRMVNSFRRQFKENKQIQFKNFENSNEFVHMCQTIQKNVKLLNLNDMIYILKILLFCNVATNTTVIQILLKLISASINRLSLKQIVDVYYTLHKVPKVPLVEVLLSALPYAFKKQFNQEDDITDENLVQMLRFCIEINNMNLANHINSILIDKIRNMELSHIVNVTSALHLLPKHTTCSRKLVYAVQDMILNNIDLLNHNQIKTLLYCISNNCTKSEPIMYKVVIINALYSKLVYEADSLQSKIYTLRELNRMHYSSTDLLDTMADEFIKNSDTLKKFSCSQITSFIEGFVIANYKPFYWEIIEPMLENYVANTDYTLRNSLFIAFLLLSMNCCSQQLIEKAFTMFNMAIINSKMNEIALIALKLHWCLKLLYPTYNGTMIEDKKIEEITIEPKFKDTLSVMESLIEAVGSDEYVKFGLPTKLGPLIDYIVVLEPNGKLMNISLYDNFKFVEELASLPNCTKILFCAMDRSKYSINTRNLPSTVKLQLRAIESLPGFYSFIINPYKWQLFSIKEKVQYLEEAIKFRQLNCSNS